MSMDAMEDKINAFLSNPDAMEKVMGMARSMGLGGNSSPPLPSAAPPSPAMPPPSAIPASAQTGKASGDGLGALLGGLQNIDPKMLSGLMSLWGAYSGGDDRREALLLSLKPYLRSERQAKLDRAAQMMRIARTARVGLKTFLGGEKD